MQGKIYCHVIQPFAPRYAIEVKEEEGREK